MNQSLPGFPQCGAAREYIFKRLREELAPDLYYHNVDHTRYVWEAVRQLISWIHPALSVESQVILETAAWYHDAGYLKQYEHNEEIAVSMVAEVLPQFNYTPEQVTHIQALIRATAMPQKPTCFLAELLCDADLFYLGTATYEEQSERYRRELEGRGKLFTMDAWLELQVKFLGMHHYFSGVARTHLEPVKEKHREVCLQTLQKIKG